MRQVRLQFLGVSGVTTEYAVSDKKAWNTHACFSKDTDSEKPYPSYHTITAAITTQD